MSHVQTSYIPGCTNKRRYADEIEAIHAAIETSFKWGKPMRHYPCECCQGYHVTSEIRED